MICRCFARGVAPPHGPATPDPSRWEALPPVAAAMVRAAATIACAASVLMFPWRSPAAAAPASGPVSGTPQATARDGPEAEQHRKALARPDSTLRDCRAAVKHFEDRQDWAWLAKALDITADRMDQVLQAPAGSFIRPAPPGGPGDREGGPSVEVQTNLDGIWSLGKGTAENWLPWVERKQADMRIERFVLLQRLAAVYRERLRRPREAAGAIDRSLRDLPFYTTPVDRLIAEHWPIRSGDQNKAWQTRGGAYSAALDELAELQEQLGQIDAAVETRTRNLWAHFVQAWDYEWALVYRQAERLWAAAQKRPSDAPLPPLLWLNVLTRQKPSLQFDWSAKMASLDADRLYDVPVAAAPGLALDTLAVTADMEGLGAYGSLDCYALPNWRHTTLGTIRWYRDKRKGREQKDSTIQVPPGTTIVYFHVYGDWEGQPRGAPRQFRVHRLTVQATFRPASTQPTSGGQG